jgi:hypothetical protein
MAGAAKKEGARHTLNTVKTHGEISASVASYVAVHESAFGRVSRVSLVHTAMRNCTRDGGGPFEIGNQVLISSHGKLLSSKAWW